MYLNVPIFEVMDSMANLSVIQYTNEKWSLLLKVAHWWQRSYGIYKCQSSARTNRKRQIIYVYIHVHIYIVVCPWMLQVNNILQEGSPRPAIKCRVLGKQYQAIICELLGIFICIYYFLCHLYPILLCTFLSFHLLLGYFYWYFFCYICNLANGIGCCCCCFCELSLPAVVVVVIVEFTWQLANRVASSLCNCTKQTNNSCLCMTQCAKARDKTFRVRRTCLRSVHLPPPPPHAHSA